jgi:benzoyl-CoA reductase subunit B
MDSQDGKATPELKHQGAGRWLQKEMMSDYYRALSEAPEKGEPVAYLFISGNVGELMRAFGFHVCFPEVNALQCGIKHISPQYLLRSEDAGYSADVCGYVKNDIGLLLSGNKTPFAHVPPPSLLVCNYAGCTTYIKWWEALAEYYGCPIFVLDSPYNRLEHIRREDIDYVVGQLKELIAVCEQVTGRRFDIDRLRETLALARQAEELWVKILHACKHSPSPLDAYFEAVFLMAPIYTLRGTPQSVQYFQAVLQEIEERLAYGLGPVPQERFRIVMEGPPPWPKFRTFWEMFKGWGAVTVASTYSKVGGLWDVTGRYHDPDHPLESIAEYTLNCYVNWSLPRRRQLLLDYARDYSADGIVIHSVKSCRSFAAGEADFREEFSKELDIPTLLIESDLIDPRYFSDAQMKNRIDAFFESLEHRKYVAARAASLPSPNREGGGGEVQIRAD